MRAPLAAALAIVLTFGCTDQVTTPTALNESAPAPSLNFGGPDVPGNSPLMRMDVFIGFFSFDDDAGYWAFHTSLAGVCGTDTEFLLVDEQVIISPADEEILMQVQQGEHNIFVGTGPISCANVVAYGPGNLHLTDNDFFAFIGDHDRSNAFGFTAQGNLNGVDGSIVHYNEVNRCRWDGNDFATLKCVEQINVN